MSQDMIRAVLEWAAILLALVVLGMIVEEIVSWRSWRGIPKGIERPSHVVNIVLYCLEGPLLFLLLWFFASMMRTPDIRVATGAIVLVWGMAIVGYCRFKIGDYPSWDKRIIHSDKWRGHIYCFGRVTYHNGPLDYHGPLFFRYVHHVPASMEGEEKHRNVEVEFNGRIVRAHLVFRPGGEEIPTDFDDLVDQAEDEYKSHALCFLSLGYDKLDEQVFASILQAKVAAGLTVEVTRLRLLTEVDLLKLHGSASV